MITVVCDLTFNGAASFLRENGNGGFYRTAHFTGAQVAVDTLMVRNFVRIGYFDIHRASAIALFASGTGVFVTAYFKNANKIKQTKYRAVGTEIFAPWSFNK